MNKRSRTVCVDTNILVYAQNEDDPRHRAAKRIVDDILDGKVGSVVTPQNILEFYAVVTDKRRVPQPLSSKKALATCDLLMSGSAFRVVFPTITTLATWQRLMKKDGIGQAVWDLFLAATLLSNGVSTLVTENVDDFTGVKGLNLVKLEEWGI